METRTAVGVARPTRGKRRMVLAVGLIVILLMIAAIVGLWSARTGQRVRPGRGGLNTTLPTPHFKGDKQPNKMAIYEKAQRDSVRRIEEREDPYNRLSLGAAERADSQAGLLENQLTRLKALLRPQVVGSAGVAGSAGAAGATGATTGNSAPGSAPGMALFQPSNRENLARQQLEQMLQKFDQPETDTRDPQLDRLNGMLDKVYRIQHGQASKADTERTVVPTPPALRLENPVAEPAIKNLAANVGEDAGSFYGIDGDVATDTTTMANAFAAMIPESQTLVAGETVAIRLIQAARIGGVTVPKDQLLYGKASLSGDRLLITVGSIRVNQSVYTTALQVFDLDGLEGIHIPGAITRDLLKQSAAQGVTGLGVISADPTLGAQAATAGIEAARTLLSRKIRLVRVTLPAGYRVYLKNQMSFNH